MENASKALFIAAGVLIGILIVSLAVYLIVSFGSTSAEIHKQNIEQQISQFNNKFIYYEGKDCTIYDVVTVANLATENNKYYELNARTGGKDNYISVQVANASHIQSLTHSGGYIEGNNNQSVNYNEIIQRDLQNMPNQELAKYRIEVNISQTTRRVFFVKFTRK